MTYTKQAKFVKEHQEPKPPAVMAACVFFIIMLKFTKAVLPLYRFFYYLCGVIIKILRLWKI